MFGHVCIINLDRDIEKWNKMQQQLQSIGITSYQRLRGVDGTALTTEQKDQLTGWSGPFLTRSIIGCALSHRIALIMAAARNVPTLILEDDIEFARDFHQRLATSGGEMRGMKWDVLFLGQHGGENDGSSFVSSLLSSLRREKSIINMSESLVSPAAVAGAFAYIVTPTGARRILQAIGLKVYYHVDAEMSMHFRRGIDVLLMKRPIVFSDTDMNTSENSRPGPKLISQLIDKIKLRGMNMGWQAGQPIAAIGDFMTFRLMSLVLFVIAFSLTIVFGRDVYLLLVHFIGESMINGDWNTMIPNCGLYGLGCWLGGKF